MDVLMQHAKNSNFPWLISNVFDAETKRPLGDVAEKHVIQVNANIRIGVIGLVEQEWIATLSTFSFDDIIYEPYVDVAKRLVKELREEHVSRKVSLKYRP
jgi:5'-nucleotidase